MSIAAQPMPYDTAGMFSMPKLQKDLRLSLGKALLLGVLIEGLMLGAVMYLFSREDTAKPPLAKPPLQVVELVEMVPPKKIETIQPEPKPQSVTKPSPPRVQPTPTPIAKNTAPSPIATPPAEPPPPPAPPTNTAPTPPQPVTPIPSEPVLEPPSGNSDIVALNRSKPNYPRRAAQAGIEGWVKLSFTVTADGQVKDIKILDANPSRLFDEEAIRAIRQWTFKPRKLDGKPVEGTAVQTVEFKLNEH